MEFEALGGLVERFLNEAVNGGTVIVNARRQGDVLRGECRAAEYRLLRSAARKSGVRLRIKRRWGWPFWWRRAAPRSGLLVGIAAAVLVWQLLASRVWVITVNGHRSLTSEEVLAVLAPWGVRVGARFDEVDTAALQLEALRRLPTVGWLTVNQSGCVLTVTVKERDLSVPKEDTAPADVVAEVGGEVCHLTVTSGQAAVTVGDTVQTGDVLIRGVLEGDNGPIVRRARGTVTARVEETVQVTVPFAETVQRERVAQTQTRAVLFGWTIPLFTAPPMSGREERLQRWLRVNGRELPLGVTVTRVWCTQDETVRRTPEQAVAEAKRRLAEAEKRFAEQTVESRAVQQDVTQEGVVLTGVYTVRREIGKARPITEEIF